MLNLYKSNKLNELVTDRFDLTQHIDVTMLDVATGEGLEVVGPMSHEHSHVFIAKDKHRNRHVIKAARSGEPLEKELAILQEIQDIYGVLLPHTITSHHNRAFLIYDYKKTLGDVISQGSDIPLLSKLIYIHRAARTVDAVHQRGYIHKDLTSKNLYPDDTMYVSDFGDSGIEGERVTGVEDNINTCLGYFSPLEFNTETKMQHFSRNGDVFQLCMVLFQWMTMKPFALLVGGDKQQVIDPYYIIDRVDEFRFNGMEDEYSLLKAHGLHGSRFLDEMGRQYPRTGTVIQDYYEFMDLVYQSIHIPELCPTMADFNQPLEQSINSLETSLQYAKKTRD